MFSTVFSTQSYNLVIWSANVTGWMAKTTPLPAWAVRPYALALPYLELGLGLLLLLGLRVRGALIASCLVLISLDLGLMFQLKPDAVELNTIILLASLLALHWSEHDRWSLDALLSRKTWMRKPSPPSCDRRLTAD